MSLTPSSDEEFESTQRLREIVTRIPNFEDYFVVPLAQCTPAPLADSDLQGVDATCQGAYGPLDVSQGHLNANRSSYRIIQMADGGITFRDATANARAQWSLPVILDAMCDLLENGIVPMNAAGVMHFDLKDDNIVFDDRHVRLIDWDHAVFLSDFNIDLATHLYSGILTLVGQPVSYAFHVMEFFNLVESNENLTNEEFADVILSEVNRFHQISEEQLAAACGFVIDDSFIKAQIMVVLNQFRYRRRADAPWDWDRKGYLQLLQYNYDVYGWWMLMLFLYANAGALFRASDAARLAEPAVAAQCNSLFI